MEITHLRRVTMIEGLNFIAIDFETATANEPQFVKSVFA